MFIERERDIYVIQYKQQAQHCALNKLDTSYLIETQSLMRWSGRQRRPHLAADDQQVNRELERVQ
jgi:hypothetical protein